MGKLFISTDFKINKIKLSLYYKTAYKNIKCSSRPCSSGREHNPVILLCDFGGAASFTVNVLLMVVSYLHHLTVNQNSKRYSIMLLTLETYHCDQVCMHK